MTRADLIIVNARTLTEEQRSAIRDWASTALMSDRQLAFQAAIDRATLAGRQPEIYAAIEEAFSAVLASAGSPSYSFWAGDPGPVPPWDAAATLAAQAAAGEAAADLITPEMRRLLVEPWERLASRDIRER